MKNLLLALRIVRIARIAAIGATLATASLVACSSSTTEPGTAAPGTEAGTGDVGLVPDSPANKPLDARTDVVTPEASTDGSAACNALTQMATEANMATIKSAAPAGSGGTILAGKYFLKEIDVYDPAGTASAPSPSGLITTLVIAGNVMDSIQDLPDGSSQTFSETFTVNGSVLTRNLTCPKVAPDLAATYTVTGTGITIYETDPMSALVAGSVYIKQ